MKYFDDIGARIERAWRARNYEESAFPDIATEALAKLPPASHVTFEEVIESFAFGMDLPVQIPDLSFGQPPITVFRGPAFYIQALCWLDGTTSIHDHAFGGAFHVLSGSSIHTRYTYERRHRFNSVLATGQLKVLSSGLLRKGDSHPIHGGRDFIHSLFHLDRPSVSIVVRTGATDEVKPQLDYFRPFVAVQSHIPKPYSTHHEQILALSRAMAARDPQARARFIERVAQTGDALLLWSLLLRQTIEGEVSELVENAARERFGEAGEELVQTARTGRWVKTLNLQRSSVRFAAHRLFLAMLLNLPDQSSILELTRACTGAGEGEPVDHVKRWIRELTSAERPGSARLLELSLHLESSPPELALDEALQVVVALMLEGSRGGDLVSKLRASNGARRCALPDEYIAKLETRLLGSSLAPLFR